MYMLLEKKEKNICKFAVGCLAAIIWYNWFFWLDLLTLIENPVIWQLPQRGPKLFFLNRHHILGIWAKDEPIWSEIVSAILVDQHRFLSLPNPEWINPVSLWSAQRVRLGHVRLLPFPQYILLSYFTQIGWPGSLWTTSLGISLPPFRWLPLIGPPDFDRKSGHLATFSEGAKTFFPDSPPYFGYFCERWAHLVQNWTCYFLGPPSFPNSTQPRMDKPSVFVVGSKGSLGSCAAPTIPPIYPTIIFYPDWVTRVTLNNEFGYQPPPFQMASLDWTSWLWSKIRSFGNFLRGGRNFFSWIATIFWVFERKMSPFGPKL